MDLSNIDITFDVWYRGLKKLKIIDQTTNKIILSNNDIITSNNNEIYLNNKLICNIDITEDDLLDMYIHSLKQRNYKFV
jgi:hypothetical protein